jgi:hypothetical protein
LYFVGVLGFAVKIIYHGGRRGNTAQGLAQWWHPVALSEARDVLQWAMHSALYHRIRMVIKIASKLEDFFAPSILSSSTT